MRSTTHGRLQLIARSRTGIPRSQLWMDSDFNWNLGPKVPRRLVPKSTLVMAMAAERSAQSAQESAALAIACASAASNLASGCQD